MRVDIFQYNNELEMLKCRAHELEGLVDLHVAIEGNMTKSGKRRKYRLKGDEVPNLHVIKADLRDVSGVVLGYDIDAAIQRPGYHPSSYPYADNWKRDWKQREAADPFVEGLADEDIIIYGDVDEIPRREVIEAFDYPVAGVLIQQNLFYGTRWTGGTWPGTTIGTKASYRGASLAEVRTDRAKYPAIDDAGWHLTWFGGRTAVFTKVQANAHGEMTEDLDALKRQYEERIWPGGTVQLWEWKGDLPRYVTDGLAPEAWRDPE